MVQLKKAQVKIISVLIALVFVGSVVALALTQSGMGVASAAASSNVGVVDYRQFTSLKIYTDVDAEMQKAFEQARQDFNEKSVNMSDEEKQQYYQQTMERLQQQNVDLMEPVNKQIEDAVKAIAEAKGLSVVLHKETVVYGGTDITQDVIKKLSK